MSTPTKSLSGLTESKSILKSRNRAIKASSASLSPRYCDSPDHVGPKMVNDPSSNSRSISREANRSESSLGYLGSPLEHSDPPKSSFKTAFVQRSPQTAFVQRSPQNGSKKRSPSPCLGHNRLQLNLSSSDSESSVAFTRRVASHSPRGLRNSCSPVRSRLSYAASSSSHNSPRNSSPLSSPSLRSLNSSPFKTSPFLKNRSTKSPRSKITPRGLTPFNAMPQNHKQSFRLQNPCYYNSLRISLHENAEPQCLLNAEEGSVVVGYSTGGLEVRTRSGEQVTRIKYKKRVYRLLSLGELVAAIIEDGSIIVLGVKEWNILQTIKSSHQQLVRSAVRLYKSNLKRSSKKKIFWTADIDGVILVWHASSKRIKQINRIKCPCPILCMTAFEFYDASFVAAGCPDGQIAVLPVSDPSALHESRTLPPSKASLVTRNAHNNQDIRRLLFVPDRKQMWSAAMDGVMHIWNVSNSNEKFQEGEYPPWVLISSVQSHQDRVADLCLIKDVLVASVSFDRMVMLWDAVNHVCLQQLSGHEDTVTSIICIPSDNHALWTGSMDGSLCLWSSEGSSTSEKSNRFSEQLNEGYYNYHFKMLGDAKEEALPDEFEMVEIPEDVGWEERLRIIDLNLGGLKDMAPSHAVSIEKALKLSSIILDDLKEAQKFVDPSDVAMEQTVVDRITVTLLEKKQLQKKLQSLRKPAGSKIIPKDSYVSNIYFDLQKLNTAQSRFQKSLGCLESIFRPVFEISPKTEHILFRNLTPLFAMASEMTEEIEKLFSEHPLNSTWMGDDSQTIQFLTILGTFIVNAKEEFLDFARGHHAAMVVLQTLFYRPSQSEIIQGKEKDSGWLIEDLFLSPISFIRRLPALLRAMSESTVPESEYGSLLMMILFNLEDILMSVNDAMLSGQKVREIASLFRSQVIYFRPTAFFLLGGSCVSHSFRKDEVVTTKSHPVSYYLFDEVIVFIAFDQPGGEVLYVSSTVLSSKVTDVRDTSSSKKYFVSFFQSDDLSKEEWILSFPTLTSKSNFFESITETMVQNDQNIDFGTEGDFFQHGRVYFETFLPNAQKELPLDDATVFQLRYFRFGGERFHNLFYFLTGQPTEDQQRGQALDRLVGPKHKKHQSIRPSSSLKNIVRKFPMRSSIDPSVDSEW